METNPNAQPNHSPLGSSLVADGLLDALPWGVLVLDEQRLVQHVNQQAARWCGTSPGALLGRPLAGADLPAAIGAVLQRLLEPGEAPVREVYLPEQEQWIALSATRQPGGWVLYGQDITPQKQREAEALSLQAELAQRTTDQYHALFYSMDQGFCVLEILFDDTGQHVVDFRYQKLNPVFSRQSGIPKGAQGKTARELMPDLESFWFDTYGRVVLTGESVRLEHYVPQVDRWIDAHVFRVGGPETRQVAVLFNDITARKQAEEQLRSAAAADAFRLRLADALGPLSDPVALQEAVTRLARQHFEADRCYYVEIEGDQGIIRRDAAADGLPSLAGTYSLAAYVLLQAVIEAGRPFSVRDVREDESVDEGLRQLCVQLQVISYLIVPVIKNGQPTGVLCLVQSMPRNWTATEATLATEVAERTWAAVERTRAEQALGQSEEKYRTLFNSIDEGFVISELLYDAQGRPCDALMLETNASYDRITQTTGTAGRRAKEVFPASESVWFETYAHVVETGASLRFENYFAPLDRWIEVYVSRVGGAGRRHFATVFNDVTERKRHEANLAFLADVSQNLVSLKDLDATMNELCAKIGAYFGAGLCAFSPVNEAAGTVAVQYVWHRPDAVSPAGVYRLADFHSQEVQQAMRAGQPEVVRDTAAGPAAAALAALRIGAFVNLPFVREGAWLFILSITASEPRDWRADELELMCELTTRIWTRLERARAEEALAASEIQYRTLFESVDEGLCTVEILFDEQGQATDYRFLEVNPAFGRQTGLENAVGCTMRELTPTHEAFWFDTYGRVARTGEAVRVEHEAAALGKFYDTYAFRIGDPSAHRVAILFHDVMTRKLADEALRQSEERFRLFVTASSDILYRMDASWQHMLYLNGRNLLADTVSPCATWLETYIPPADHPTVKTAIRTAIADPHFFALEHRVVCADGSMGWTSSHAVPVLNARGELLEWFCTATDITAHKQAEEALRVSEVRYRALFETMGQGYGLAEIIVNEVGLPVDYRMLEINPQFENLTGQNREVFLNGRTVREIAPDLEEEWYEFYGNVALTGVPAQRDIHAAAWNRWFEVAAYPTGHPERRQVGIFFSDITARKRVEQRLAEFSAQLEQQVVERTHELRESRRLLQTVFDASPAAIVVMRILHDAAGRAEDFEFLITNEFNKQIVGRDDLAGQRFSTMFPQTGPAGVLARLLQVATTGEPVDFEQWYVGEGMQQWFRLIAVRQDGLLVMTSEVITARKQAEQERTRTLRLLEQAEAVASLGSWDYDLLTREFLWSEGMYRLFGLPSGQPVSPDVYLQFVVDEDRVRAEQFVRYLTTGSTDFEETLHLRVGAQVKTVRLKLMVLHDEAGQPVRVLGVDLDISQLQRLEADNLRLRLTQQQALFEAVQAAQETERKRMAESLHNGISQTLYATKLRLDQLQVPLLDTNAALVTARNEADRLLGEAICQTRALSHELVPMVLEKFGLATSLQDIGRDMSTPQLRFRCQVQLDEDAAPLAPALQMALYRMAQELAQNIVKHARSATQASLELETMPGWALLRAEDNGAGFATSPTDSPGLGLRSIRDRVALLGGQLEMGSAPTDGAYVRIRIPIPASPAP